MPVKFKRLLSNIEGGNVLDIGCGSGQFTEILVESLGSFDSLTGIDVDEESLSEARKKFPGKAFRFLEANSRELPFVDESFDLVAMSNALHHVENTEATLSEMKRVLKTGGKLLINEMHRDQLTDTQESHMLYHHLRSEIDNVLGISHNLTFHREDLIRLSNNLDLNERVIMEFIPDDGNSGDTDIIAEYIHKIDGWMQQLDGHSEKERFAPRVESLKARFRQYGVSRPPQMLILGRK